MKTYNVLYAKDIPHYGTHEIEAESDEAAIQAAKDFHNDVDHTDPAWDDPVCARIVHIEDPDGNEIARDVSLDEFFLCRGAEARCLHDAANDMLAALENVLKWWTETTGFQDDEMPGDIFDGIINAIAKARRTA